MGSQPPQIKKVYDSSKVTTPCSSFFRQKYSWSAAGGGGGYEGVHHHEIPKDVVVDDADDVDDDVSNIHLWSVF